MILKVMNLEAGQYIFEGTLMPWTAYELTGNYDDEVDVPIDLSLEEIQGLIDMMHWAYKNDLFEYSTSEMVCTYLLEERQPQIYNRVYPLVHKLFCDRYPNGNNVEGFGDYEIFIPDKIRVVAWNLYKKMEEEKEK